MTSTQEDAPLARLERLAGVVTSVAAPLTLVTALLFYFGYASSRAQYRYFGIDVDTIGLSTRDYVMRSPQVLLTPVVTLLTVGFLWAGVDAAVRRRVAAVFAGATSRDDGAVVRSDPYLRRVGRTARTLLVAGYCVLAAGGVLLASYPALRGWAAFSLVTPLVVALGSALAGYGHRLVRLLHPHDRRRGPAVVAMALVFTTGVFWSTATLAEASGRGLARDLAQHVDRLPGVILDTTERLYLTSPGIEETVLPQVDGQTFRFRYRGLRLLIQGPERLLLVPGTWSASNSTVVIPMDDASMRLQFRFVNDPP